ncbi:hypothetical protein [Desulfosporosinus sp. Sb-LF]|uniref:hypothetical protein n=1 Tax=Desulfosporosinus sp. Sb-LF TaxID=2560027 RepID=UPI00107FA104|nr:hypothetical protein [Desulfosporosinus sp. Sb-LF]
MSQIQSTMTDGTVHFGSQLIKGNPGVTQIHSRCPKIAQQIRSATVTSSSVSSSSKGPEGRLEPLQFVLQ